MIEERVVIQQHRDENDDRGKNSTNEIWIGNDDVGKSTTTVT